jgi:hypothetical protein
VGDSHDLTKKTFLQKKFCPGTEENVYYDENSDNKSGSDEEKISDWIKDQLQGSQKGLYVEAEAINKEQMRIHNSKQPLIEYMSSFASGENGDKKASHSTHFLDIRSRTPFNNFLTLGAGQEQEFDKKGNSEILSSQIEFLCFFKEKLGQEQKDRDVLKEIKEKITSLFNKFIVTEQNITNTVTCFQMLYSAIKTLTSYKEELISYFWNSEEINAMLIYFKDLDKSKNEWYTKNVQNAHWQMLHYISAHSIFDCYAMALILGRRLDNTETFQVEVVGQRHLEFQIGFLQNVLQTGKIFYFPSMKNLYELCVKIT